MEIMVHGIAESSYIPNEVLLRLRFCVEGQSYEEVFKKGTNRVLEFVNSVLLPQGFSKENMKTEQFLIQKENRYNEKTNMYEFVNYSYLQTATLEFDYEREQLAIIMEEIRKLSNPPLIHIDFTLKDIQACKRDMIDRAYQDAYNQAFTIAKAAGKTLKDCMKIDFQPNSAEYVVRGYENLPVTLKHGISRTFEETMNTIFTPQNITVSENLYCLWVAE